MASTKLYHANGTAVSVDSSKVDRILTTGVFSKSAPAKKAAAKSESDKK